MTRSTHQAFALAGALASVKAASLAGINVEVAEGAVLTVAAVATAMLPDKLEGPIFAHRGVTHRWWVGVLVALLAGAGLAFTSMAAYAVWLAAGVGVGYGVGHLLADGLTRSGLPKRKLRGQKRAQRMHLLPRWLRPRTGTFSERPFRLAAVIACVLLGWSLVPATTRDGVHDLAVQTVEGARR